MIDPAFVELSRWRFAITKDMPRFRDRLFGVNFAPGAAAGLTMKWRLGANRP